MDCRETQTLLAAFHDGELPAADRARVEAHLRCCRECGALLADLARADQAAGVPDPGPAYWDRFNARVMDRVTQEATGSLVPTDGPRGTILRPKHGWMRRQLRYLVPAAAVAALVVAVVRYEGMLPGVPGTAMHGPVPGQAGIPQVLEHRPMARDGQVPGQAGMPRVSEPRPVVVPPSVTEPDSRSAKKMEMGAAGAGGDATGSKTPTAMAREERYRPADRSLPAGKMDLFREGAGAGREAAGYVAPASPPMATRGTNEGMRLEMQAERKKTTEAATLGKERQSAEAGREATGSKASADGQGWPSAEAGREATGSKASADGPGRPGAGASRDATDSVPPAAPCERALALAERERFPEAEIAQRACLASDLPEPAREKGLVFLAELLDRQARFADADAVIAEIHRQFPESVPLDRYLRRRPMVQKRRE